MLSNINTPDKFFQLRIPKNIEGIDVSILNLINTWDLYLKFFPKYI